MPAANWRFPTSGKTPLCGNCPAWKAKSMWTSIVICRWIGSWSARARFSGPWQLVISRMVTWCSTILPVATLKEPTPRATSSPSATIAMASGVTNRWGIALLCSAEGCPVGVEVFAGNTQDASTVPEKIAQLQRQYGLKEIIFVGDRGMITKAVADKIKGTEGLHTISALTHRQIVELLERKVITAELFDEAKIVEVFDPEEPKRRYCLCRNPLSAGREGKTRERLLERTRAELDKIAGSKRRASAKTLGARVGRVLERSKMGKFVRWDVLDGRLSWSFDQEKIAAEKLFDGCYIVSGEVPKEKMVDRKST